MYPVPNVHRRIISYPNAIIGYRHREPNVHTSLDKAWISTEELTPPAASFDLNCLVPILKKINQKEKQKNENRNN